MVIAAAAALAPAAATAQDDDIPEHIAAGCGGDLATEEVIALPAAERQVYVACGLRGIVAELNGRLPIDIFGDTLVAASASGTTITMTFDVPDGENEPGALQRKIEQWRTRTCGSEDGRSLIEVGGAYRFVWVDSANVQLSDATVDRC